MAREVLDDALCTLSDKCTPCCIITCIVQNGPLNSTKYLSKNSEWRRSAMKISLKMVFEVKSCRNQVTKLFPALVAKGPLSSTRKRCLSMWTPNKTALLPQPMPKWGGEWGKVPQPGPLLNACHPDCGG